MKTLLLCVLFFAACSAVPAPGETALKYGKDPRNFQVIGTREYYLSSDLLDVLSANKVCNDFGMQLITLEDPAKNTEIKDFLVTYDPLNGSSYWTFGRKFRTYWQWTGNGRFLNAPLDWAPTMPSYTGNEDICVGVRGTSGWFDNACAYNGNRYICEHYI